MNIGDFAVVPMIWLAETIVILAIWVLWHPKRVLAILGYLWAVTALGLTAHDAISITMWFVVFVAMWWAAAGVVAWFPRPRHEGLQLATRVIGSWEQYVGSWWRPWWRERWVYGRAWGETMQEAFLTIVRPHAIDKTPRIRKIDVGPFGDAVHVKMLKGHTIDQYERSAEAFAEAFGMQSCRVYPRYTLPGRWRLPGMIEVTDKDGTTRQRPGLARRPGGQRMPGHVTLEFSRKDVLADTLAPIAPPATLEDVDMAAVAVGRTEGGERWTLKIRGSHLLVAGITGAGKGSILWSIIKGLGPAIRVGLVDIWAFDPKGGMELHRGRPLFRHYEDTTPAAMNAKLGALVKELERRTQKYKLQERDHTPTLEEPHIVCIIDECAALLVPRSRSPEDRKIAEEAKGRIALVANQGRAVGITLLLLLQNPRKEVIDMRDEIPDRIGMRLLSAMYGDMVFWQGAAASGIRCDRILRSQPGRAFAWNDQRRSIIGVRATYVSDDEIAELVTAYAPGPRGEDLLDELEAGATR